MHDIWNGLDQTTVHLYSSGMPVSPFRVQLNKRTMSRVQINVCRLRDICTGGLSVSSDFTL